MTSIDPAVPVNPANVPAKLARNQILSDMLVGGDHPFPADMEQTLRRICAFDPSLIDNLDHRYFAGWKAGQDLGAGRAMLRAIEAYVATKQNVVRPA